MVPLALLNSAENRPMWDTKRNARIGSLRHLKRKLSLLLSVARNINPSPPARLLPRSIPIRRRKPKSKCFGRRKNHGRRGTCKFCSAILAKSSMNYHLLKARIHAPEREAGIPSPLELLNVEHFWQQVAAI